MNKMANLLAVVAVVGVAGDAVVVGAADEDFLDPPRGLVLGQVVFGGVGRVLSGARLVGGHLVRVRMRAVSDGRQMAAMVVVVGVVDGTSSRSSISSWRRLGRQFRALLGCLALDPALGLGAPLFAQL